MEQSRLLIAIVLSLVIFLAWQFFFAPTPPQQEPGQKAEAPAEKKEQQLVEKDQVKPYSADRCERTTRHPGCSPLNSKGYNRGDPALRG